ncbi:MAG: DinB family protein [Pirellulales bacterium]
MSLVDLYIDIYKFNRGRTLGLLDAIDKLPDPQAALGWRPGPGRAHIGWQLMHLAVTEEIFATERLAPSKAGAFTELWPRFRGGSTPDDNIPTSAELREKLAIGREHLFATLREFPDSRLQEIPPALAERKLTIRNVLDILSWHEAHHQGQAHITLNLYKAANS